jgi:hypothetical protein
MKKILYFVLATAMLAMFGCTGDNNSTAVKNPNATALTPTGTIQGMITDSCSGTPIVGAVIDIGVAKATTNSAGQYVLLNVPATKQADSSVHGKYSASIDLRNATLADGTVLKGNAKYPAWTTRDMKVVFTTLDGSGNNTQNQPGSANGNNPAVPVVGLVSGDQDITVGLQTATVKVTVFLQHVAGVLDVPAAGYFVELLDSGGNVVAGPTQTAADGTVTFTNIENGSSLTVSASKENPTTSIPTISGTTSVSLSSCGGATTTLHVAPATPCLINTNPVKNANIAPAADGSVTVTFTFNNAIDPNSNNGLSGDATVDNLALTSDGNPNSLHANVDVEFLGFKDSNVAFQLNWVDNKTLQVIIPNAQAAAIYKVDIRDALNHDSTVWAADDTLEGYQYSKHHHWKITAPINATDDCGVSPDVQFYTFGASQAQATTVQAINGPYDYNTPFTLSWLPAVQAKAYNVYCQPTQVYTDGTKEVGGNVLVDQLFTGTFDTFGPFGPLDARHHQLNIQNMNNTTFVENGNIKIIYNCFVAGVNADGTEGLPSNIVGPIQDTVKPVISSSSLLSQLQAGAPVTSFSVTFDEPMAKATVETAANYAIDAGAFASGATVPTVTTAVCRNNQSDGSCRTVDLTMSAAVDPTKVNQSYINTGANGKLESFIAVGDANVSPAIAFGNGLANSACIIAAATAGTAHTTAAGDDVQKVAVAAATTASQLIVDSGANGICETTVVAPDVQALAVGNGQPNVAAIMAGADFVLQTFNGGDDKVVDFLFLSVSNVKDVAGNAIDNTADPAPPAVNLTKDQINTNGAIH